MNPLIPEEGLAEEASPPGSARWGLSLAGDSCLAGALERSAREIEIHTHIHTQTHAHTHTRTHINTYSHTYTQTNSVYMHTRYTNTRTTAALQAKAEMSHCLFAFDLSAYTCS